MGGIDKKKDCSCRRSIDLSCCRSIDLSLYFHSFFSFDLILCHTTTPTITMSAIAAASAAFEFVNEEDEG